MSVRKGDTIIAYGKKQVEAMQREMGELVYSSTPLDNESYHLADGSVLTSTDYSEFITYMSTKVSTNPECFCTEVEWQATATLSVTGSCGKYVYDSTNNTLRIPKYNGILESTITNSDIGNLTQAGLPQLFTVQSGAHTHTSSTGNESAHTHTRGTMNISGAISGIGHKMKGSGTASASGAFTITTGTYTSAGYSSSSQTGISKITFTASNSGAWTGSTSAGTSHTHTVTINSAGGHTHTLIWNPTIQNTNTVQPETTKILTYIIVKAIPKSIALVDFDNYASDLNQKADTDLSNLSLSQSTKHNIGRLYFPSDTYIDVTLPSSGGSVTAPADGFFACAISGTAGSSYMELAKSGVGIHATANFCGGWGANFIPVRKGDVVYIYYGGTTFTLQFFRFVYAESEV